LKDTVASIEPRMVSLLSQINFYKNRVEEHVRLGYHERARALHENGRYHAQFLQDKEELEGAVH